MSATLQLADEISRARGRWSARAAVPCLLAASVVALGWFIVAHPGVPVWDQQALLESQFAGPVIPAPATGFTSQLIVALVKLTLPEEPALLNGAVRLVAMMLYLSRPLGLLLETYGAVFNLQGLGVSRTLWLLLAATFLGWLGAWISVQRYLLQLKVGGHLGRH